MNQMIRCGAGLVFFVVFSLSASSTIGLHKTDSERLDSIENKLPYLEQKVLSTLYNAISSPVAINGEARLKVQYHKFLKYPMFLGHRPLQDNEGNTIGTIHGDYTYLQSAWDEALVKFEFIVRPGRNTVLFAKIGFSHTFPGNRLPDKSLSTMILNNPDNSVEVQSHHNIQNRPANVFEDMNAGIAIRTNPASFWFKMGNMLWIEASPFSIWRSEPRMFAWDYLPWEENEPISDFYDQRVAKGEAVGRAAWNKKPFAGINLESIELPLDFYFDVIYARGDPFDSFEREYLDMATDLGYAADAIGKGVTIESGIGDPYRHVIHARLAKKMYRDLTLGLNFNALNISPDFIYAQNPDCYMFNSAFNIKPGVDGSGTWDSILNPVTGLKKWGQTDFGRGFYKEPYTWTLDLRGSFSPLFSIFTDIGVSLIDTTWIVADTIRPRSSLAYEKVPIRVKSEFQKYSDIVPALYTKLKFDPKYIGIQTDLAYMGQGFYSPYSFVSPMDAFWPFGSSYLIPGMFTGNSDGSPYVQNMMGGQLTLIPKLPWYGHFNVKYGLHTQVKKSRDLIYFPFRLNGRDMNSIFLSTHTKYGVGTVDFPMHYNYLDGVQFAFDRRLGDESYKGFGSNPDDDPKSPKHLEQGPDIGGLHSGEMSLYESFVPYPDSASAIRNLKAKIYNVFTHDSSVPVHKKWTYNLEMDVSYDIAPIFRYKREIFLGFYGAVNGISIKPKAFSVDSKDPDVLIWSWFLRMEPAMAVTKKFYILGLLGWENWRADNAWMEGPSRSLPNTVSTKTIYKVPIDYLDQAYGLGFDWDVFEKVSLHGRFKWMSHEDRGFNKIQDRFKQINNKYVERTNDWEGPLGSLELKVFF